MGEGVGRKDWAGRGLDLSGSSRKLPMQVLLNPCGLVDLSDLINNQILSPKSRDCIRGHLQFQDVAIIFCLYVLGDLVLLGRLLFIICSIKASVHCGGPTIKNLQSAS